jgi:hypothetical protein
MSPSLTKGLPCGNILGDVTVIIRFITVLVFWPTKNCIFEFFGKLAGDITSAPFSPKSWIMNLLCPDSNTWHLEC